MIHLRYHEGDWRLVTDYIITKSGERVSICSLDRPSPGARPLTRKGESEWVIAPVEFQGNQFRRIPDGVFLLLTHSPPDVNARLAALL